MPVRPRQRDKENHLLGDEVTMKLRDAIVRGELKPRQRLIEVDLAAAFNVSRTPVRDAIRQLELAGLVQREPYRGAVVADLNMDNLRELYTIRIALEGMAARLATPLLTEDDLNEMRHYQNRMVEAVREWRIKDFEESNIAFHRVIYAAAGNQQLRALIQDLLGRTTPIRRASWRSPRSLAKSMRGHEEILAALESRDPLSARDATESHIRLLVINAEGGEEELALPSSHVQAKEEPEA